MKENKKNTKALLPLDVEIDSKALILSKSPDSLQLYIKEISRYDLLSPEEEETLTRTLIESGDIEIAKKLVKANLRLVVKIAMEYRHSYSNVLDLIQEGNIGLMKAVSKFDPDKGAKLSYYASWWIRSYILKFILDNFRLIKIGTTAEQKRLFYNLLKEKDRLMKMGIDPKVKLLSENLGVSEKAVTQMEQRLLGPSEEIVLDTYSEDGQPTLSDIIADPQTSLEEQVAQGQELDILNRNLKSFVENLPSRDKEIFKKRLLSETPASLQAIATEYGVSRERIRQVEERLLNKLKVYMAQFIH
ncbi:MAG: RNA polymerase factor sigma-32 [Bacteriovoracaceae bacterium]|nr:RNA polymerase factor sigma-32 [Bacteriovoracaceae bacterium]